MIPFHKFHFCDKFISPFECSSPIESFIKTLLIDFVKYSKKLGKQLQQLSGSFTRNIQTKRTGSPKV